MRSSPGSWDRGTGWCQRALPGSRFLISLCDLVGAPSMTPRGRFGPFFRLPGRGVHLEGGSQQVGWSDEARGTRDGRCPRRRVRRWPLPLAGPRGPFFFQRAPSEIAARSSRRGPPSAGLGPAKNKQDLYPSSSIRVTAPRILSKTEVKWPFFFARAALLRNA
jgi:hypothetical protein